MSTGELLKLIAIVVPLGLDTLGVSIALGMRGLTAQRRVRVAVLFASFEAAMPLIGVLLGAPVGRTVGGAGDFIGAALIATLGAYMLVSADRDDAQRLISIDHAGVVGAAALGISVSLDELAIGFSAGLLRLDALPLAIAVSVQAFVMTHVGLRVGARIAGRTGEAAERLAGLALIALAAVLVATRLG